ncbi:MAG TPA: hypothetical protein VF764_00120 [Steroidobacteraceae bacterium]
MSDTRKRQLRHEATPPAERRRIAAVVHDDRGNASVEWRAAPANHERPVLELQGEEHLTLTGETSYDPYARNRALKEPRGTRTDLRRLSEWIKMMRVLEERRRNEGDNGADGE